MATKRRGANEGSIFQRADGRWVARIELGRDDTGKRIRKTFYGTTKAEAQRKLTAALDLKSKALPQPDATMTVKVWCERWLKDRESELAPISLDTYRGAIRNYIVPTIGEVKLAKLTPGHVDQMTREIMVTRGLSATTARMARRVLGMALKSAMAHELIHRNVVTLSSAPKENREHRDDLALTELEAKAVIRAAEGDRLAALAVVLLTLGLRKGEVLALRWENIDFEAETLEVAGSISRVRGQGLVRGKTKTMGSARTLPMPPRVMAALKAHRDAQWAEVERSGGIWGDLGIVFASDEGTYTDPRNALRVWHSWTVAAGLGKRRMHASRHTAATLMITDGVPLEIVSALLGHSSISITNDVYARAKADAMRRGLAAYGWGV